MKSSELTQLADYTASNEIRQNGAEMSQHGYRSRYGFKFYDPDRKEARRKEAERRNSHWKSLSPEQQLAELDQRFGKGLGAKKQREQIRKKIEERNSKEKNHGNDSKQATGNAESTERAQEPAGKADGRERKERPMVRKYGEVGRAKV